MVAEEKLEQKPRIAQGTGLEALVATAYTSSSEQRSIARTPLASPTRTRESSTAASTTWRAGVLLWSR